MKKLFAYILFLFLMISTTSAKDEIQFYPWPSGCNIQATIRDSNALIWNKTGWEIYSDANITDYNLSLTDNSENDYSRDFPTEITTAGKYRVKTYLVAGSSLAITDEPIGGGEINWDGSAEITVFSTKNDINNLIIEVNNIPTAAENRDAIFAKTSITAGGTWTFEKIVKLQTAWLLGNWQEPDVNGTYEIMDGEDPNTAVLEYTPSETGPPKEVTVP